MNYDVIIPAGKKDVHRVPHCVESLKFLNPKPDTVYVVTPEPSVLSGLPVVVLSDDEVFQFERKGKSPNWTFQQFIKLFQTFTKSPLYLSVDSDLIFAKPLDVFGKDGQLLFWRYDFAKNSEGSFRFIEESLGMRRVITHAMMSHFMMFDRQVCRELMARFLEVHPLVPGKQPEAHFYEWVVSNQGERISMSEFELYSNFVATRHPGMYDIRVIRAWDIPYYLPVSVAHVERMKAEKEGTDFDVMTVHSRFGQDSF